MSQSVVKHVPSEAKVVVETARVAPRPFASPRPPLPEPSRNRPARVAKIATLTPELRRRILEIYEAEYAEGPVQTREVHAQIASTLWIKRQLVADVIREVAQSKVVNR
jgi:hypothetical protein